MKTIFFTVAILCSYWGTAQIKIPLTKPKAANLQQIVSDLDYNFYNLTGDKIGVTPDAIEYKSKVGWTDSAICKIIMLKDVEASSGLSGATWQAEFAAKEAFSEAAKSIKNCISKSIIAA